MIHMRIVNTMCISKEIAVSHYVDLTVKFFKEIFEITYSEGEG